MFVSARSSSCAVLRFFSAYFPLRHNFWRKKRIKATRQRALTTRTTHHVGEIFKRISSPNDDNDDDNDGDSKTSGIECALLSQRFEQQRYRLYEWSTRLLFFQSVFFFFFFYVVGCGFCGCSGHGDDDDGVLFALFFLVLFFFSGSLRRGEEGGEDVVWNDAVRKRHVVPIRRVPVL